MSNTCKDCVVVAYADVYDKVSRAARVGFVHMDANAGMVRKCVNHRRSKGFERFLQRKKGKILLTQPVRTFVITGVVDD